MGAPITPQVHSANLRHVRDTFPIDPRASRGSAQIAPFLSRVVQLVHPAFPGSFNFSAPEIRSFPDPAAGANFTTTVTPNQIWRLEAVRFQLVTDANAANREVLFVFDENTVIFMEVPPQSVQAASLTNVYCYGLQFGYEAAPVLHRISGLPNMFLQPGWTIRTAIQNIQVGDQITDVAFLVDVFPA